MARRKEVSAIKKNEWITALYIRLSKEDGNDISLSVKNQEELLKHYIDTSEEEFILYDTYVDDGKTGTDTNRESFQRMIQDIEDKKVNCVVVKDLSRLSRNASESGHYLEQYFVLNRTRFISIELPTLDSFYKPDEISSLATHLQNVINEDFCRQTSIKIRGVFNVKRSNGQFIGSFAPYGYLKDPSDKYKLIIDENVSQTIKDIFNWFVSGESKTSIAKKLNTLGILSPTDYKKSIGLKYSNPHAKFDKAYWSTRSLDTILKNQMYIGDMIQGRGKVLSYKVHKQVEVPKEEWFIVEDTHEAIIDKETFEKAQKLMLLDIKTSKKTNEVYLFSGLLRCYDCRRAINRTKSRNYAYYECRTYKRTARNDCTKHTIKEEDLIKAVTAAINLQFALVENLETIIDEISNSPVTKREIIRINKALKSNEDDINKINQIKDSLYMDWKLNVLTKDDYFRMKDNLDEKLKTHKESLLKLKDELKLLNTGLDTKTTMFEFYRRYKQIDTLDRSMLLDLIEVIYIKENKQIEICFKYTDQIKRIVEIVEKSNEDKKNVKVKTNNTK